MKKAKSAILIPLSLILLSACGVNDEASATTITIKAYKGGYGTSWLYTLKEKFETIYAKENYRVNIIAPSNTLEGADALADMRLSYKKNGVDIYFVQNVLGYQTQDEGYGACAESLTDIYDTHPISFDGTEESKTIKEKLKTTYNSSVKYGDDYYSVLWASSPCGLIVNTQVLSDYNLSIPKTTDELFSCYNVISAKTSETGVYPFSWGGSNSYGYSLFALYPMLAQLLGQDAYNQFIRLQKEDGDPSKDDIDSGYKLYDNDLVYAPLTTLAKIYASETATANSQNDNHSKAHYNVTTGKAAFTFDGEFFFNEVKNNYSKYLNNVTFVNTPVHSGLGKILEITDKTLSDVISLVDEGKSVQEIVAATSLDENKVTRIKEARTCYYEKANHNAYITKGSSKVEIAKLFLRMATSDDFGKEFNKTANANFPYASSNSLESDYPFVNGVSKVTGLADSWGVNNTITEGLRYKANIKVYEPYNDSIIKQLIAQGASEVSSRIRNYMTDTSTWAEFMQKAGYEVSK